MDGSMGTSRAQQYAATLVVVAAAVAVGGCYPLRPSEGGGQTDFSPPREVDPSDIAVPAGYAVEKVTEGLTFPSAVLADEDDQLYVVEAGYSYGPEFAPPRLLRVHDDGTDKEIARGDSGPWTGAALHDGTFYIAASGAEGRILQVSPDGNVDRLIGGLPGRTDHHTNGPVVGADGWLYFGQGTATNSAVVGLDNFEFGWLSQSPERHDMPCRSVTLAGENFSTANPLDDTDATAVTGAYVPFGTRTSEGERIEGQVPCTGAILRVPVAGGSPEVVAWGLRNPFGLAFSPEGELFATDNGFDERGSRPVFGAADYLWRIKQGAWYGWPDFVGGRPITDNRFRPPGGPQPEFLLRDHPQVPPAPRAVFGVHSSSNGLDFSRSPDFGHVGDAFVAQFGDMAAGTGKVLSPVGFRVVRVDPETGVVDAFATNRQGDGPASWLGTAGLERPVDVQFSADGRELYVLDFGVMTISDQGPVPRRNTGVLWRIRPTDAGED